MDEDKINSQTKFAARNNTLQSAVSSSDNDHTDYSNNKSMKSASSSTRKSQLKLNVDDDHSGSKKSKFVTETLKVSNSQAQTSNQTKSASSSSKHHQSQETELTSRKISKSSSYKQRELDYSSDDEHSSQYPKIVNIIEIADFPSKNNCRDLVSIPTRGECSAVRGCFGSSLAAALYSEDVSKIRPWENFQPLSPRRLAWLNISILEQLKRMQSVPETRQNSLVNEGEDEMDLLFPINEESDFEVVEDKLKKCSVFRKKLLENLILLGGNTWIKMIFNIMEYRC